MLRHADVAYFEKVTFKTLIDSRVVTSQGSSDLFLNAAIGTKLINLDLFIFSKPKTKKRFRNFATMFLNLSNL